MILTTTNINTAQGRLWNRSTTSGTPSVIHLVEVDGNRVQSGIPHGMNQSERAPSRNYLTLAGNPSGMNLLNGSPILGISTSTTQTETAKKRTQSNTHHL